MATTNYGDKPRSILDDNKECMTYLWFFHQHFKDQHWFFFKWFVCWHYIQWTKILFLLSLVKINIWCQFVLRFSEGNKKETSLITLVSVTKGWLLFTKGQVPITWSLMQYPEHYLNLKIIMIIIIIIIIIITIISVYLSLFAASAELQGMVI